MVGRGRQRDQLEKLCGCVFVPQDGRLCAAAFVQNRKSCTGCTCAPNPADESGRPWCCVEAQVPASMFLEEVWMCMLLVVGELLGTSAAEAAWNYCAPAVDYNVLRKEVAAIFADKSRRKSRA